MAGQPNQDRNGTGGVPLPEGNLAQEKFENYLEELLRRDPYSNKERDQFLFLNKLPHSYFDRVVGHLSNAAGDDSECLEEEINRVCMLLFEAESNAATFLVAQRVALAYAGVLEAEASYARAKANPDATLPERKELSQHLSRANQSFLRANKSLCATNDASLQRKIRSTEKIHTQMRSELLMADRIDLLGRPIDEPEA